MVTENIVCPDLEENQQQQLPAIPTGCTLSTVFEQVSAIVLTPFNVFWRHQQQEEIRELDNEFEINTVLVIHLILMILQILVI